MRRRRTTRLTLDSRRGHTVPLALVAALALYPLLRRPILTWGATSEETASRLTGDELLEDADGVSTRAITIDAPEASVWPWLAQLGPSPRGGAYTYDWIENLLGLDMHSVDRVLPEFQHPEVGDTIGLGSNRMRLEQAEPGHVLALALRRRKLGVDVRAERARRHHPADQPQPLPPPDARRPCRHVAHGAGVALDGAEDVAWDQKPCGAARVSDAQGSKRSGRRGLTNQRHAQLAPPHFRKRAQPRPRQSTLLSEPLSLLVRPTYVWVSRKRRIARPGQEGRLPAPHTCFGSLVAIIRGHAITLEPDP